MTAHSEWRDAGRCAICPATDRLWRRFKGELSSPECARIEQHVSWCPECQHDIAGFPFLEAPPETDLLDEVTMASIGERWRTLPIAQVGEVRLLNPSRLPYPEIATHVPAVVVTGTAGRLVREVMPVSLAPFYSGPGDWVWPQGVAELKFPAMILGGAAAPVEQRVLGPAVGSVPKSAVLLLRRVAVALLNEPYELPDLPRPAPRWSTRRYSEPAGDYTSYVREAFSAVVQQAQEALGVSDSPEVATQQDSDDAEVWVQVSRRPARVRADVRMNEDGITAYVSRSVLQITEEDVMRVNAELDGRVIAVHTTPMGDESPCIPEPLVLSGDRLEITLCQSLRHDGWTDVLVDP